MENDMILNDFEVLFTYNLWEIFQVNKNIFRWRTVYQFA